MVTLEMVFVSLSDIPVRLSDRQEAARVQDAAQSHPVYRGNA